MFEQWGVESVMVRPSWVHSVAKSVDSQISIKSQKLLYDQADQGDNGDLAEDIVVVGRLCLVCWRKPEI